MWAERNRAGLLRFAGPFLEPLGRASLYVYIVHSLICFFVSEKDPVSLVHGTLLDAAVLGAIWAMVRFRVLFALIPR
jgi:hypothetical protein